jgi:anti-sigma B factor antagonist
MLRGGGSRCAVQCGVGSNNGHSSSVECEENQMHITERIVGDVAMVEVIGDIVANSGDAWLRDKIRSLREQGYTRVLVDLGHVRYMDSSGLGDLVHAYATTKKAGGTLKLLRVTKRLRDLLTITKLVTVFETYDDEPSALASFAAAA